MENIEGNLDINSLFSLSSCYYEIYKILGRVGRWEVIG